MKTFTATHLNKHAQEVFAAAKDGPVLIEHDRYEDRFIILQEGVVSEIAAYILSHESDIAYGINDFAELRNAFVKLIGREADKDGE